MRRTIFHVNSFTRSRFSGNPAGVVLDADGMTDGEMQLLARELKHSETAFVLLPDAPDHDLRLRYFTPTTEVPTCGHATIAAHVARSIATNGGAETLRQKNGAGIQRIQIVRDGMGMRRVYVHQGAAAFEDPLEHDVRSRVIAALGLDERMLLPGAPVQIVSTSSSKVIVPLAQGRDMDRLRPDMGALSRLSEELRCNGYFVFHQRGGPGSVTDGRMFAPAIGIDEDPVTGNANGPLGAYLVRHGLMQHDGRVLRFEGRQGRALRRDGVVHVEVSIAHGEPAEVTIAGDAVVLFQAEFHSEPTGPGA